MNKMNDEHILYPCSQCGEMFTKENMIEYETVWVCANCKPVFMQKIKEGIEIAPKASNMTGWKIFFFIFLALELYSFAVLIQHILNAEKLFESILDLIVDPFVIVALFGFSFEKKIWNRNVWKILFPVAMLSEVIGMVLVYLREPSFVHRIAVIVVVFAFSPLLIFEYIALYKYAFSKRKPWI
jgi:succinate dehydrogenase/fumarate reductase cytochrome b subunit